MRIIKCLSLWLCATTGLTQDVHAIRQNTNLTDTGTAKEGPTRDEEPFSITHKGITVTLMNPPEPPGPPAGFEKRWNPRACTRWVAQHKATVACGMSVAVTASTLWANSATVAEYMKGLSNSHNCGEQKRPMFIGKQQFYIKYHADGDHCDTKASSDDLRDALKKFWQNGIPDAICTAYCIRIDNNGTWKGYLNIGMNMQAAYESTCDSHTKNLSDYYKE